MTLVEILGWTAGVVGPVVAFPQLARLVRGRTSAGLSLANWQIQAGSLTGWAIHGVHAGFLNIVIPNIVALAGALAVLWMISQDRHLSPARILPPIVGVAVVLGLVEFLTSSAVFGIVVVIPLAAGLLQQAWALVVEPNLRGVSVPSLLIMVIAQGLWLAWGLLAPDPAIIICATVLGAISLFNAAWAGLRTSGVRTPGVQAA